MACGTALVVIYLIILAKCKQKILSLSRVGRVPNLDLHQIGNVSKYFLQKIDQNRVWKVKYIYTLI